MTPQKNSPKFHVCKPLTAEHRRAMRWFSSLSRIPGPNRNLKHSVEFYSLFAMTGDTGYLGKCEEFLGDFLGESKNRVCKRSNKE